MLKHIAHHNASRTLASVAPPLKVLRQYWARNETA